MVVRLCIYCFIILSKIDKYVKYVSLKIFGFFFFDDLLKEIV